MVDMFAMPSRWADGSRITAKTTTTTTDRNTMETHAPDHVAVIIDTPGEAGMDRLTTLAARLLEQREIKDSLKAQTSRANAAIAALEESMCETMMTGELGKFTFRGKTFYMSERAHISSKAETRDSLIEWLDDHGHGALAKRTVNSQSLGSLVRELRDDNGGNVPDDIADFVNVHIVPSISIRKG